MEKPGFKISDHPNYLSVEIVDFSDSHWLEVDVKLKGGAFQGSYKAAFNYFSFEDLFNELVKINKSLNGTAEFNTLEHQLDMKIIADGLGHIKFEITARDSSSVESNEFQCSLNIDQTQLPELINQLNATNKFIKRR